MGGQEGSGHLGTTGVSSGLSLAGQRLCRRERTGSQGILGPQKQALAPRKAHWAIFRFLLALLPLQFLSNRRQDSACQPGAWSKPQQAVGRPLKTQDTRSRQIRAFSGQADSHHTLLEQGCIQ